MTDTAFVAPLVALYPTSAQFAHPIKAFFNGEIRRFNFVGCSFNELLFELNHLGIPSQNFCIRYQDEEGDWITVTSDLELAHAFELFGNKPVRFDISPKSSPTIVPSVAPNSPTGLPRSTAQLGVSPARASSLDELKVLKKQLKHEEKLVKKETKRISKFAKKESKNQIKQVRDHFKEPRLVGRFVKHVTVEDNYEFVPGTAFVKTWRFRNEGTQAWPQQSVLVYVGKKGDQMGAPDHIAISRAVLPGEEIDISVAMNAPLIGGSYFGYWRLAEPSGKKFGQRVRVLIRVVDSSSSSSEEKETQPEPSNWGDILTQLESMGFKNKALNVKLLVKSHGDMDRVVHKLLRREQKMSGVKRGNH